MASGSQAQNGNWALFVIPAIRINLISRLNTGRDSVHVDIRFQCPCDMRKVIAKMIITSPIRLVNTVIIPLFREGAF